MAVLVPSPCLVALVPLQVQDADSGTAYVEDTRVPFPDPPIPAVLSGHRDHPQPAEHLVPPEPGWAPKINQGSPSSPQAGKIRAVQP